MKKIRNVYKNKHKHAAFFLGACHKVVNSTLINVVFAVVGFVIGCTSSLIFNHMNRQHQHNNIAECRIVHYVDRCRQANDDLVKYVNDLITNNVSTTTNDCDFIR